MIMPFSDYYLRIRNPQIKRKNHLPAPDVSLLVLLSLISACYVVIPITVGSFRFPYFSSHHKPVFFLMLVSLTVDIISFICREYHLNTTIVFRLFTVVEFILLSSFFIRISGKKNVALAMKIIVGLFCGVTIFDAVLQGVMSMDNLSVAVESIVFIFYCIFSLFLLMREAIYTSILSASRFWIIMAVLLYFSGNLFVFIFSNYLLSQESFTQFWGIHSVLNICFYTLIAIGFWKSKTQSQ